MAIGAHDENVSLVRGGVCAKHLADPAGALFAPVRNFDEVFSEPAVVSDMLVKFDHPTAGQITSLNNPIRLSETPVEMRSRPPLLGEHTDEVLGKLAAKRTS